MKLFTIIISHVFFNFIKCQPHKLYEHINQQYPFFSTVTAYNYVSPVTPYPEPGKSYKFQYNTIVNNIHFYVVGFFKRLQGITNMDDV